MPEAAQGLPFVFDTFDLLGCTTPGRAVDVEPSEGAPKFSPSRRSKELTLDNLPGMRASTGVVSFETTPKIGSDAGVIARRFIGILENVDDALER